MKLILKQIGLLMLALLVLYSVLLVLSLALVPRSQLGERLNSASAGSSLFLTEPKYVFMTRSRLNTEADKVLLLGASNTLVGFKQGQVQALLPGTEVHNISVGGSNITQLGQIVDLVREVQTPEARRHNTFALGLWYGIFASDKARWNKPDRVAGDTDIDIERYRYGFYRRTESGPVPVLPPGELDLGVLLIHPYLVLDRTARDVTKSFRAVLAGTPPAMTDTQRNAVVISEAAQRKYLDFWREYTGFATTLGDAPFKSLEKTVDEIVTDGGRVVLVDLPIPQWHAAGSPLAAEYRQRMDELMARLQARPGVTVLKMNEPALTAGDEFSDEIHPKPRITGLWAQRLADALKASTGVGVAMPPR
jgi:hypothetical protein